MPRRIGACYAKLHHGVPLPSPPHEPTPTNSDDDDEFNDMEDDVKGIIKEEKEEVEPPPT
jgi:hypothetical protein